MKKLLVIFCVFLLIPIGINSQQGSLESGKNSLQSKESETTKSSTTTRSSRRSNTDDDELDRPIGQLIARLFFHIAAYTTYGVLVETPSEKNTKMHDAEIANYPYQKPYHGTFIYTDSTNYKTTSLSISSSVVRQHKDLFGVNTSLNFRFLQRFDAELGYLYLTEHTPTKNDSYSLYSVMLNYHRVRTQKVAVWYGIGAMYVGDEVAALRPALGVGAQWFVKKPISLKAMHKWAYINDETVGKTSFLLNYHLKKTTISSGYSEFKIGTSIVKTFSLGVGLTF